MAVTTKGGKWAIGTTSLLVNTYFEVWNAHDVAGIKALHAATSKLTDWDASHGPTNEEVSQGIASIWQVGGSSNHTSMRTRF